MNCHLPRNQHAAASLLQRQVKIWAQRDFALQAGQAAHLRDDVPWREEITFRTGDVASDIVWLDDIGAKAAQGNGVIVVDRDDARWIRVLVEKLRPVGHHNESQTATARFAQNGRAKKVVTQAARSEKKNTRRPAVAQQS
jgi:hypothetical protein